MSIITDKNIATEINCGSNFAYNLVSNDTFSATEYKVLQSQANGCFVRCMKNLYNGHIQLYYMPESYKPFSSLLSQLDTNGFLTIVANLFSDIIDVNAIGFLTCQNIDISLDHVFVDSNTYKVKLVYIPLISKIHSDQTMFENDLRSMLIKCIANYSNLESDKLRKFSGYLSDGALSLVDVKNRANGSKTNDNPVQNGQKSQHPNLLIIALNAPQALEISVNKDSFLIGKKADSVDGCIPFNNYIGRIHCRIDYTGQEYTITDLESKNGTYLNRVRLQALKPYVIKNNDVIRLANSDFRVAIR